MFSIDPKLLRSTDDCLRVARMYRADVEYYKTKRDVGGMEHALWQIKRCAARIRELRGGGFHRDLPDVSGLPREYLTRDMAALPRGGWTR
jgi:hypothetical protein